LCNHRNLHGYLLVSSPSLRRSHGLISG
jgi:hypothetical protein